MTVSIGIDGAPDSTGWTTFTYPGDANAFYVSNSTGNDANDGKLVAHGGTGPWKTGNHAIAQLNAKTNNTAYWLLFQEGDTFNNGGTGEHWGTLSINGAGNGTGAGDPIVMGSYDPATPTVANPGTAGSRPKIVASRGLGFGTFLDASTAGDNLAICNLDFYCSDRDPGNTATVAPFYTSTLDTVGTWDCLQMWQANSTFLLIEGCKISFFVTGIDGAGFKNVYIRRNTIVDQYNKNNESQGMFIQIPNPASSSSAFPLPTISENIFDNNGHDLTSAALNHNIYVQMGNNAGGPYPTGWTLSGTISVYGNILSNDPSGCQFRSGALGVNNLFIAGSSYQIATANPTGNGNGGANEWHHNIFTEINANSGDFIEVFSNDYKFYLNTGTTPIHDNIFFNQAVGGGFLNYVLNNACSTKNVTLTNNTFYNITPRFGTMGHQNDAATINTPTAANGSVLSMSVQSSSGVGTNGDYTNISLTGGTVTDAPNKISCIGEVTVSGNAVTAVAPWGSNFTPTGGSSEGDLGGNQYVVGDILSGSAGGCTFTVRVDSVSSGNSESGNSTVTPSPSNTSVATYASSVGLTASTAAFVTAARGNEKHSWNSNYTAPVANNYFRRAFNLPVYPITHHGGNHLGKF